MRVRVAEGFGLAAIPPVPPPLNHHMPGDGGPSDSSRGAGESRSSARGPLSMADTVKDTVRSRRVSILVADGVDAESLRTMREVLLAEGAAPVLVAPRLGPVVDSNGREHWVEQSLLTGSSVLFDAVYVPGGAGAAALAEERDAIDWICEAYRHCKPIAATGEGMELLIRCPGVLDGGSGNGGDRAVSEGVLASTDAASEEFAAAFTAEIARHRFWERAGKNRLASASGDRETRGYGASPAARLQPRAQSPDG